MGHTDPWTKGASSLNPGSVPAASSSSGPEKGVPGGLNSSLGLAGFVLASLLPASGLSGLWPSPPPPARPRICHPPTEGRSEVHFLPRATRSPSIPALGPARPDTVTGQASFSPSSPSRGADGFHPPIARTWAPPVSVPVSLWTLVSLKQGFALTTGPSELLSD